MNSEPRSNRTHIVLFGRCNSGKSTLLNAMACEEVSIVSQQAGTTTDVVRKNIELPELGACVLLDTAGLDDNSLLAQQRIAQTRKELEKAEIGILVIDGIQTDLSIEKEWMEYARKRKLPFVAVLNKADCSSMTDQQISEQLQVQPIRISALRKEGMENLFKALATLSVQKDTIDDLTGNLTQAGNTVLLVMPQDSEAPKGRLILPQVQTIRHLIDKGCIPICCTPDTMRAALQALQQPPQLIITDSQAFKVAYENCPEQSKLTSFSILFARYKGDIRAFAQGANRLLQLNENARILIAEACSHVPQQEDIGRVKLPNLLRKKIGNNIHIDIVSGNNFPEDISSYDLIIHCGACMFTRHHVLNRIRQAEEQHIPITNYGIALAALNGILNKVALPE